MVIYFKVMLPFDSHPIATLIQNVGKSCFCIQSLPLTPEDLVNLWLLDLICAKAVFLPAIPLMGQLFATKVDP